MNLTLLEPKYPHKSLKLLLFLNKVPAGFPSPADDYIEIQLDLNEYLVKHPSSTFYAKASGNSMINAGILDGALLVVDRSIEARDGDIVIAVINGELSCKILDTRASVLRAANLNYKPIPINEDIDNISQGVVIHVVNTLCTRL